MPREKQHARVLKWRGDWYLFYTDHSSGKQRRRKCRSMGAANAAQRAELVRQYRAVERRELAETTIRGSVVAGDILLVDDIRDYLGHSQERARTRAANPDVRSGLSDSALQVVEEKIEHFLSWLKTNGYSKVRTVDLTADILFRYFNSLIGERTQKAKTKSKKRTAATVNVYKRNVKACLRWINSLRPRRFVDFELLLEPLKPVRGKKKPPTAYSPDDLVEFLSMALERESADRLVEVAPGKDSRKKKVYSQRVSSTAATPVSRLFILLALTGCRLGEALNMKWEDVNLERGRISIDASKTGIPRWLPLSGDSAGEVAPRLLELLRGWWEEDTEREFVLSHGELEAPTFPKGAWYGVDDATDAPRINPQRLRQNFTSYAASIGVPAAVAAMWQGHSAQVAERYYRAQVLESEPDAESFEDAMGLTDMIEQLIAACKAGEDE